MLSLSLNENAHIFIAWGFLIEFFTDVSSIHLFLDVSSPRCGAKKWKELNYLLNICSCLKHMCYRIIYRNGACLCRYLTSHLDFATTTDSETPAVIIKATSWGINVISAFCLWTYNYTWPNSWFADTGITTVGVEMYKKFKVFLNQVKSLESERDKVILLSSKMHCVCESTVITVDWLHLLLRKLVGFFFFVCFANNLKKAGAI